MKGNPSEMWISTVPPGTGNMTKEKEQLLYSWTK